MESIGSVFINSKEWDEKRMEIHIKSLLGISFDLFETKEEYYSFVNWTLNAIQSSCLLDKSMFCNDKDTWSSAEKALLSDEVFSE